MSFKHLLPQWMEIATQAALLGGRILKEFWGKPGTILEKEYPGDLVTEIDKKSETVILDFLSKHLPEHQILAEESGISKQESPFIWAIDPLDGTTNFAHQYPVIAISIGLLHENESILGVIYNPLMDELFQAAKGLGAKLNQLPIKVSKHSHLRESLLSTGFAYNKRETINNNYAEFCHFTHLTHGVRRCGAAALDLAYVACGRLDGFWESGLKTWDIAAGAILIKEAGGFVSDYNCKALQFDTGRILATNGLLHQAMSQELKYVESLRFMFNEKIMSPFNP